MKTLLINGSPRKDGNTAVALNEIAKPLETEGCVFDDDAANTLAEKMAEAGAVVVGSPVYYGQPNGALLARPGAVIAGRRRPPFLFGVLGSVSRRRARTLPERPRRRPSGVSGLIAQFSPRDSFENSR